MKTTWKLPDKAMADPGGGGGGAGKKQNSKEILHTLRQKSLELLEMFDQLPAKKRLEGLDILQDLVSTTISKITNGKVKGVKFVPLEEKNKTKPVPEKKTAQSSNDSSGSSESYYIEDGATPEQVENQKKKIAVETPGENNLKTIDERAPPGTSMMNLQLTNPEQQNGITSNDIKTTTRQNESYEKEDSLEDKKEEMTPTKEETQDNLPFTHIRSSRKAAQRAVKLIHDTSFDENVGQEGPEIHDIKEEDSDEDDVVMEKSPLDSGYQCRYCAYSCETKDQLNVHRRIHTGKRQYQCEFCHRSFSAVASLKRHKLTHTGTKQHQCPVCEKHFYTLAQLKTHSFVHTGEKLYHCKECDKCYTNSANLARHRRVHTGETPYACTFCDAKYRDLSSLKLHILKHTGEKPYLCEVCFKQFKTSSDFRRHERTHTGERKYSCKICGQKFIQGWHVKQHMKIHTDERPWLCQQCGNSFRTKASLEHHTKSHLGIKDYTCHHCGKSFSTKRYLQCHQVVHTTAKPYKCSHCPRRFNQYSNLKRHERIHNDKRPYKCRYCEKDFKYINSLQYHEGIHRGVRKVCHKCGLGFKSPLDLEKHQCDPLKYTENLMTTVCKEKLVVQLERLDPEVASQETVPVDSVKQPSSKPSRDRSKFNMNKIPKIVLRISKSKILKHNKKSKLKMKKLASKKKVRSKQVTKSVENTDGTEVTHNESIPNLNFEPLIRPPTEEELKSHELSLNTTHTENSEQTSNSNPLNIAPVTERMSSSGVISLGVDADGLMVTIKTEPDDEENNSVNILGTCHQQSNVTQE